MKIFYFGNFLNNLGYTMSMGETFIIEMKKEGFDVIGISSKKNKIFRLIHMISVALTLSKEDSKVVIDIFSTKAKIFAIIIGKILYIRNVSYVVVLRGGGLPKIKNERLVVKFLSNAQHIVSPSHYLFDHFHLKFKHVVLIPNFIPLNQYKFRIRQKAEPKFLWVRSLHKIYNPNMLIDIALLLEKCYKEYHFYIIGPDKDGSKKKLIERIEKHNLHSRFTILGKLSKEEWRKYNDYADIFLNTTNYDNMPVSLIEALALGFPVVSTNVGGVPKLIDNYVNGILVNPRNPSAFVEAIKKLTQNQKLSRDISKNGRLRAEQYDWEYIKYLWFNILNINERNLY